MWMLGIELMCGRAVGAFNCRPISAVLSCYAGHAFLGGGWVGIVISKILLSRLLLVVLYLWICDTVCRKDFADVIFA